MFPSSEHETAGLVETLQALTERLSAPDLTIAEADVLRPRLLQLLNTLETQPAVSVRSNAVMPVRRPHSRKVNYCVVV